MSPVISTSILNECMMLRILAEFVGICRCALHQLAGLFEYSAMGGVN